jgi:hypothetical protein
MFDEVSVPGHWLARHTLRRWGVDPLADDGVAIGCFSLAFSQRAGALSRQVQALV